ncbi:MAG: threonylcarbamoyl-AMP synthase [Elusimicrobiota bacterium]|jgi:L-threonylcarbamoyladenylate synthase|nr:threonylcarbamoyl-AMP synthase [Elusimicrobiota bacterium]
MKKAIEISTRKKDAHKITAKVLKNGGIAIIPTETVYGFAASAFNTSAMERIYEVKGRDYKKPLIIMAANIEALKILVNISDKVLKIASHFWPGQLTLILPTTEIGKILSGGKSNLGVRIPNSNFMLSFLREIKIPIWTTSANISGRESIKDASEIYNFETNVDIVVNGGKCKFSFESTVVDMVAYPYTIIRKGCLDTGKILKFL